MKPLSQRQYERLLQFRTAMRRFVHWSEEQAKAVGVTPAQHQLLLAVKGHPGGSPTIREIADYLLLRHHSAVELLDRTCRAGLTQRTPDARDGRVMRANLTDKGEEVLARLTRLHVEETRRLAPMLDALSEIDEAG